MPIKYNPTTPGRRQMSAPSFSEVTKSTPEKSLIVTNKKKAGRNNTGRITVRHRGGGNMHSICQQIWKTHQWPQDWQRSVFSPIPKKGNVKDCSN